MDKWFHSTNITSLAKNALKEAQKTIDKALDIEPEDESTTSNSLESIPDVDSHSANQSNENEAQNPHKKKLENVSIENDLQNQDYYMEWNTKQEEPEEDNNWFVNGAYQDEEEEEIPEVNSPESQSLVCNNDEASTVMRTSFISDIPLELVVPDSKSDSDPINPEGNEENSDAEDVQNEEEEKVIEPEAKEPPPKILVPAPTPIVVNKMHETNHKKNPDEKRPEPTSSSNPKSRTPPPPPLNTIDLSSLNSLTKEKFHLQNRVDNLTKEVEHLRKTINLAQKQSFSRESELKTENMALHRKIQDYELKLSDVNSEIADSTAPLSLEIEKLQRELRVKSLENERILAQYQGNLSQAELNLKNSIERERSLKESNISLKNSIQGLEENLEGAFKERKKQEEESSKEIKRLNQELDRLRSSDSLFNESKKENERLKAELEGLDNQLKQERIANEAERKKSQNIIEQIQLKKSFANNNNTSGGGGGGGSTLSDNSPPHSFISEASYLEEVFDPNIQNVRSMTPKSYFDSFPSIENYQTQLRHRDSELIKYQEEERKAERLRKTLNNEIANLTCQNQELLLQIERMNELESKLEEMQKNYSALLQMYGEKVEENEELKLDLQDVKEMYKIQIEQLVSSSKSSSAPTNE